MNATDADEWMKFAEDDLASAKKLIAPPDPRWGTGAYHCQQAAEKAMKALLVLHGGGLQKRMETHDIGVLLEKLAEYIGDIEGLEGLELKAEGLSQLSTMYRYPGLASQPLTQEVIDKAVADAELFLSKARQLIVSMKNRAGDGSGGGASGGPATRAKYSH